MFVGECGTVCRKGDGHTLKAVPASIRPLDEGCRAPQTVPARVCRGRTYLARLPPLPGPPHDLSRANTLQEVKCLGWLNRRDGWKIGLVWIDNDQRGRKLGGVKRVTVGRRLQRK